MKKKRTFIRAHWLFPDVHFVFGWGYPDDCRVHRSAAIHVCCCKAKTCPAGIWAEESILQHRRVNATGNGTRGLFMGQGLPYRNDWICLCSGFRQITSDLDGTRAQSAHHVRGWLRIKCILRVHRYGLAFPSWGPTHREYKPRSPAPCETVPVCAALAGGSLSSITQHRRPASWSPYPPPII